MQTSLALFAWKYAEFLIMTVSMASEVDDLKSTRQIFICYLFHGVSSWQMI